MPEPAFQALQRAFAAHIRDPERHPVPPGVDPRRMAVYTELFFSSMDGHLRRAFPVLSAVLGEERWRAMVRDFYARHRCREPLFVRIAGEFLGYLAGERCAADDPPFLRELAHWEWVELDLLVHPDPPEDSAINPDGDLLEGVPVPNPLLRVQAYAYPVHRIAPGHEPAPEQTLLAAWRDPGDRVRFMALNAPTAMLLERMQSAPASGRALLEALAGRIGHPDPEALIAHGAGLLAELRDRGVLLGARSAARPS